MKSSRAIHAALALGFVFSFVVTFAYFLHGFPFWLDESFVATTLRFQPISAVFGGLLSNAQQFPRVYLALIRIIQEIVGFGVHSLRVLPFLFWLAALLTWLDFIRRERETTLAFAIVGTLLFIENYSIQEYSVQLKQYSAEVFASAWAIWILPRAERIFRAGTLRAWLLIGWPVFFSYSYPIVLAGCGMALIFEKNFRREIITSKFLALTAAFWIPVFVLLYRIDLQWVLGDGSMRHYWRNKILANATWAELPGRLGWAVRDLLSAWWTETYWLAYVGLAAWGAIISWRSLERLGIHRVARATGLVMLFMLGFSIAGILPIDVGRISLFFAPLAAALVCVPFASFEIGQWRSARGFVLHGLFLMIVVIGCVRKLPGLVDGYAMGKHWRNIASVLESAGAESDLVVYDQATANQIRARTNIPERLKLIITDDPAAVVEARMRGAFFYYQEYPLPDAIEEFAVAVGKDTRCEKKTSLHAASLWLCVSAASAKVGAMQTKSIATFAGGCFWGVEELIRSLPGVTKTTVGYTGGITKDPVYAQVKTGTTGHAEAIEVEFDPKQISYGELLDKFFQLHDPTTSNRQGNDIGTQYRSAIFFHDDSQKREAEAAKERAAKSGRWKDPVVTEITAASKFYPAEEYHQDYLQKNPGGYTCHYWRK